MKVVNSKEGLIMSLFMIRLGCAHNDEATRQMVPHKKCPIGPKGSHTRNQELGETGWSYFHSISKNPFGIYTILAGKNATPWD